MILRKTFHLTDWQGWARQIDSSAKEFFEATGHWPNLLLANEAMLRRIDFLANQARQNIVKVGAEELQPGLTDNHEWRELGGFCGVSYSIEFCLDELLPAGAYSLIYDANPDGDDGEPVPKLDNVGIKFKKYVWIILE